MLNYLIFIAISIFLVLCYMVAKWSARYQIGTSGVTITPLLRAEKIIPYSEIESLAVGQGFLAKRFHCGSIYIQAE